MIPVLRPAVYECVPIRIDPVMFPVRAPIWEPHPRLRGIVPFSDAYWAEMRAWRDELARAERPAPSRAPAS